MALIYMCNKTACHQIREGEREYSGKERGKKMGINVKMLNGLFSSCGKTDRGVL